MKNMVKDEGMSSVNCLATAIAAFMTEYTSRQQQFQAEMMRLQEETLAELTRIREASEDHRKNTLDRQTKEDLALLHLAEQDNGAINVAEIARSLGVSHAQLRRMPRFGEKLRERRREEQRCGLGPRGGFKMAGGDLEAIDD